MTNKRFKNNIKLLGKASKFIANRYIAATAEELIQEKLQEQNSQEKLKETITGILKMFSLVGLFLLGLYIKHLRRENRAEAIAGLVSEIMQLFHGT